MLGIDELLHRKPKALSGGQRQRVAVGRAIVRNPAAFLFDEPLSNLDAKLRVETRAELKHLHMALKTTTIYVTHDQEEAMTLGDRIVVMQDGIIQQCAPPLEVYERPRNRFVAGFVGMPPMNFFDGKVVRTDAGLQFDEGSNRLDISARFSRRLEPYVDKDIVMGVRPENFSDRINGLTSGGSNSALRVTVRVIEPLGQKMDVYTATPKHGHIVSRINAHSEIRVDSEVDMYVDMENIHFFRTGETGTNITLEAYKEPARA
jgi:multiple sugar transport system ATP-binding protein